MLHYRTGGVSTRPTEKAGWNHLYGFRIKDLRWHRSFWRRYLADMDTVAPPDAAECRRLCHEKIARADFLIGLAETPRWKLPLALPGNLARSLRARDPAYLQETLKYLAGPLYMARLDAKTRRRAAGAGRPRPGPPEPCREESVLIDGGDRHTIRAATRGGPSGRVTVPRVRGVSPLAHTDPTPHALQTPPWLYARGAVRPWGEATLHVNTEAVRTGFHVFEGLKAFWQVDGGFGIVNLRDHHARLQRSARIMRMPFAMGFEAYEDACHALLARLARPTSNMWLRTTLFLVGGHWGQDDVTDLVITAFDHPKGPAAPMATGVTAWRRANDNALPARVKTGANYLVARFSKIESRDRGYREMILLNDAGRVAEFVGSALLMVRDGVLVTPPASEGAFESITALILEALARDLGIPTARRPIERTELLVADELASAGSLNDLVPITAVDGLPLGPAPILEQLGARYLAAVTGEAPHPAVSRSVRFPDSVKPRRRGLRKAVTARPPGPPAAQPVAAP